MSSDGSVVIIITFYDQCDSSCHTPNFIRGTTAVDTRIGGRGSHDIDKKLAPSSVVFHVCSRRVLPLELRERQPFSAEVQCHIFTLGKLFSAVPRFKLGGICETKVWHFRFDHSLNYCSAFFIKRNLHKT